SLGRTLTPPELGYQRLEGVDEDGGAAWVVASPDPRQGQVYRVPLAEGQPAREGNADGVFRVSAARRGGAHAVRGVLADGSDLQEVRRRDGSVVAKLESVA